MASSTSSSPVSMPDAPLDGRGGGDGDIDGHGSGDVTQQQQQLKSALWLRVGQLVDNTTLALGGNATPQFIGALTELLWHQVGAAAGDIEAFARHAGRTTITAADVVLLARRNEALKGMLESFLAEERTKAGVGVGVSGGRGGRGAGAGAGASTTTTRGTGRSRARGRGRGK